MSKTLNIQIEITDDIHKQFVKYCKNNKIYRGRAYVELLEKGLQKESGSPARDAVETLAQNYKESKED